MPLLSPDIGCDIRVPVSDSVPDINDCSVPKQHCFRPNQAIFLIFDKQLVFRLYGLFP